jgi:hypothetical protein
LFLFFLLLESKEKGVRGTPLQFTRTAHKDRHKNKIKTKIDTNTIKEMKTVLKQNGVVLGRNKSY